MPEYIERAAAAEFFEKSKQVMWHKDDVAATVSSDKIPAADVVEVVRCKDCNYRVPISEQQHLYRGKPAMHCILHSRLCRENDYCSYGERKDGKGDGE